MKLPLTLLIALVLGACSTPPVPLDRLIFAGADGPGQGKKVVLISGDEEYRSEEGLTQLGRILAERHGFDVTVLFAIDPETGIINPHVIDNIPGLEALDDADLAFLLTRWRRLPADQMSHVDSYLRAGKPLIALRTATHAFAPPEEIHGEVLDYLRSAATASREGDPEPTPPVSTEEQWGEFGHYGDGYIGPREDWRDGFGRLVVGERWVSHHGHHKHESTRGVFARDASEHAILRGIADGDIWGPSDVYTVRLPLPGDSQPLVLGEVRLRQGEYDEADAFYGMRPDDGPASAEKNDPMMPVAWAKTYQLPGGTRGRVFSTTMGASTDLVSEGTRKMILNAAYWALEMEDLIPDEGIASGLVGNYEPTRYENHPPEYWVERGLKPADLLVD